MISFCETILASFSPEEWGIFNHTLIKAAHLPQEPVGGGLCSSVSVSASSTMSATRGGGGFTLADVGVPDIASVGGACCNARSGACLASCWEIVGVDKTPDSAAAAGLSHSRRHTPSSSLRLPSSG